MTLERGTLLHKRYRIVEILGQGGMGSVYRAVDENLGVEVAVKDNLFTTEEYARQFRLEAVILASLRHTNLPRVTDHFVIGEQGQYLVMDYIEGEDLRQRMERQGVLLEEDAILIGAAMCDALQYLHTRKPPIVHRDVKPGNVKITSEGHVYLVDFGLAKMVRGNQATTTGARAMTPGYSPPEQYGTARTDPRSDIYSLGATLYAALTGVIPEDGLARAMDNVELTPVRKRNSKISRRLAQVVEKAMAVRPDDRFQTAEEFKLGLLSANVRTQKLEGDIVVEPPPQAIAPKEEKETAPEKPAKIQLLPPSTPPLIITDSPDSPKRKTSPWIAFSFFLLTVVAALIALIVFWTPISAVLLGAVNSPTASSDLGTATIIATGTATATESVTQPVVSAATSTVTPRPTNTTLPSRTPTPSITPTPTNTLTPTATLQGGGYGEIAFVSNRSGVPQIYLMKADGNGLRQITNIADGACQPDWSPDGLRIVFTSPCLNREDTYPGAHLSIINADGSGLTPLPDSGAGDFDPAWSPDGIHIAFSSLREGIPQIYILNLTDNSVNHIVMDGTITEARQPAWSPSGMQIVYTVKRVGVLQIWVMSATGDGQAQLVRSGSEYYDFKPAWSPDGQMIVFTQSTGAVTIGWLMGIRYDQRETQTATRIDRGNAIIDAAYSPDSQWLAFETNSDANYEIGVMRVDGSGRITITNDPALDFDPAWRPYLP
jgi:serine/threonine protein kinase/Tol biopolymer transport system component